nr:MAG: RNA-dependent RNA polymerase [Riboviria sp.]
MDTRTPEEHQVVVGIDVDYYVDNIDEVIEHAPAIFYTFNPIYVSGMDGDTPYRIKNSAVDYSVSGGTNWQHRVWDWCSSGEFLEIRPRNRTLLHTLLALVGIRRTLYAKVYHARPWNSCPNRAIVWVLPETECYQVSWIRSEINARRLARVEYASVQRPGWNSIVYPNPTDKTLMISIGREGEDLQLTIPKAHHDLLLGLGSGASVTSRMIGLKYTDPLQLALFGQYYSGVIVKHDNPPRIGYPVTPKVHWPASSYADRPEISARVYATCPISDESMVPMIKRWETLSVSLDNRVTFVANNRTPKKRIQELAHVFVSLVVPPNCRGDPYSLEDTAILLDKPTQALAVRQIWETADMEPRRLIEAFIKNEPCNRPGRIISSFADMRYLLKLSAYTLKFRDDVLHAEHNQHWFCPGSTPTEIAKRIQDYVANVDTPIEGDYSNFDGTVSAWLQTHVMNAVMMRYFGNDEQLGRYLHMLISCPARAKRFGFAYEAGCGVKSGSPTTCDLNTVLNAFLQFCAVVATRPELSHGDAFRSIGLAFGDDSLFDIQYRKQFVRIAEEVGMQLKVESTNPELGVTFLARVFPDPRRTLTSFQDPLRTWRKLHITMRDPNVPLADAALDRVEGYLVTDGISPVVGAYCRWIVKIYTPLAASLEQRQQRKSHGREKPYWLTVGGESWPQDPADSELMYKCAAARVGLDVQQLYDMEARIATLTTPFGLSPVDREVDCPYSGTLDADSQPVAPVDPRIEDEQRTTIQLRAGGGNPRPCLQGSDHPNIGHQPPGVPMANRAEGPDRVSDRARRATREDASHGGSAPGQAEGRGVPPRRGGRPNARGGTRMGGRRGR